MKKLMIIRILFALLMVSIFSEALGQQSLPITENNASDLIRNALIVYPLSNDGFIQIITKDIKHGIVSKDGQIIISPEWKRLEPLR